MKYGYYMSAWQSEKIAIPIQLDLWNYIMLLMTGGTGSGKTTALITLLGWLLQENNNIEITLCDFKGLDFQFLEGYSRYFSGDDTYEGIMSYYEKYTNVRKMKDADHKRILIIDEYASLINYLSARDRAEKSKLANDVLSAISEMLMLGRGIKHGVWISVQRADASLFQGGSRDNFQVICALGRLSREQKQMLFSGEELPADHIYEKGQGLLIADGMAPIEVQFPVIIDCENWKHHIVHALQDIDK